MSIGPGRPSPLEPILPAGWRRPRGYSNGVRVPSGRDLVFVAGQVGWDETGRIVSPEFPAQFERALRNCLTVVEAAGGSAGDVVRLTMYCSDRHAYASRLEEVGAAYRRVMGGHYPTMSLVEVAGLLEEGAQIEIEAIAAIEVVTASRGAG